MVNMFPRPAFLGIWPYPFHYRGSFKLSIAKRHTPPGKQKTAHGKETSPWAVKLIAHDSGGSAPDALPQSEQLQTFNDRPGCS